MKQLFGKLLVALHLFGFAPYVSADLPSRTGLVALGCEPNVKTATLPSTHPEFRVSPRKRYVFMNRDADGVINNLCLDEIDTNEAQPVTCASPNSGSIKVVSFYDFGFRKLEVFRKDSSMVIEQTRDNGGNTQHYSCTPSKDPGAILDFVINQKRTQRSQNAF